MTTGNLLGHGYFRGSQPGPARTVHCAVEPDPVTFNITVGPIGFIGKMFSFVISLIQGVNVFLWSLIGNAQNGKKGVLTNLSLFPFLVYLTS
jgi:hypothetical protein